MRKEGLSDEALVGAIAEMEDGVIVVSLGGREFKKRVAFPAQSNESTRCNVIARLERGKWFGWGC